MIVSLDIETVCAVQGCPGFDDYKKCEHALSPWHNRITVIGVVSETSQYVFRGIDEFNVYNYPNHSYVGHNFKFDYLNLVIHGANITRDQFAGCTQLMAYVCTEKIQDSWLEEYERSRKTQSGVHRRAGKHSLKALAPYFLGVEPFWETDNKDDDAYVLKDAKYTYDLYFVLEAKLKELGQFDFYQTRLLKWTKLLVRAELRGIQIDLDALAAKEKELQVKEAQLRVKLDEQWADAHRAYHEQLVGETMGRYIYMREAAQAKRGGGFTVKAFTRYKELENKAIAKLPTKIEFNSPKQMTWLLKEYLGYDITSLEGDEGTGREILERLANEGKEDVQTFLEWRKVQKLLTAFIPTFKDLQVNGTLHPIYNPSNTVTGRTSSQMPNAQQCPPEIKKLIKAEPGYVIVGQDLSAIEAVLIALYSDDEALSSIIREGISIHDYSAKRFLDLPCEVSQVSELYPNERSATKNCIFALFFNAGANRIRITFAQKGIHLSQSECKQIHSRFKQTYPLAYQCGQSIVEFFEQGNVMENLLGRPLKIQNPEDCFMTALNLVVQSSASDLLLEWASRCDKRFQDENIDGEFCLFVHDFMGAQVVEHQAERAQAIMLEELAKIEISNAHGPVKLRSKGGISVSWKD